MIDGTISHYKGGRAGLKLGLETFEEFINFVVLDKSYFVLSWDLEFWYFSLSFLGFFLSALFFSKNFRILNVE